MSKKRQWKLFWRWSFLTSGLIALYWTIYYLATGEVPVANAPKLWGIVFPVGISRWWDVLIAPLIVGGLVKIGVIFYELDDIHAGLVGGSLLGLAIGLMLALVETNLSEGLAIGLGLVVVMGLLAGLINELSVGRTISSAFFLAVGLSMTLAYGLFFGLGIGLGIGLALCLGSGLVAGLVTGLVASFKKVPFEKFWGWLWAEDTPE